MTSSSLKFKERMLLLRLAFKDFKTGEIQLGTFGDIHEDLLERINDARNKKGLHDLNHTEAYQRGRGYIRKDTKEFLLIDDAIDWASATGYDRLAFYNGNNWCGESLALREYQTTLGREKI